MIKAVIKSVLVVIVLALFIMFMTIIRSMGKKEWYERARNIVCGVLCFIVGLRVKVEGEVTSVRPVMVVSNHISYLDILILGWKTPVIFTPKNDMEKWPVIGTICRLIDCVFIERRADKIKESREKIEHVLAESKVLSIFPEGTTGNGLHMQPFKSSLFSIAEQEINMYNGTGTHELFIQPAVISYTKVGSLPIDSTQWPMIAWYGDMDLAPHLWQLLKLGRIDAKLTLLPPVTMSEFGNRKKLAAHCQEMVMEVLQAR